MKQTAIEWLMEEMSRVYIFDQTDFDLFKQATEMFKQQIIESYNNGQQIPPFEYGEKYYNETFKNKYYDGSTTRK